MPQIKPNINLEKEITILEVLNIGIAEVSESGGSIAHFPCVVRWTDVDIDKHIADLDPELTVIDNISIRDCLKVSVTPGKYKRVKDNKTKLLFEKIEKTVEAK
jgi:hypothetical protein